MVSWTRVVFCQWHGNVFFYFTSRCVLEVKKDSLAIFHSRLSLAYLSQWIKVKLLPFWDQITKIIWFFLWQFFPLPIEDFFWKCRFSSSSCSGRVNFVKPIKDKGNIWWQINSLSQLSSTYRVDKTHMRVFIIIIQDFRNILFVWANGQEL